MGKPLWELDICTPTGDTCHYVERPVDLTKYITTPHGIPICLCSQAEFIDNLRWAVFED